MVIRGPRSFDDLKTVDRELCETFHDACLRCSLLEDDGEWEICLWDATEIQTGSQLHHLFTTLLLFCMPTQPNILWITFWDKICDDLQHKLHNLGQTTTTQTEIYDYDYGCPKPFSGLTMVFGGDFQQILPIIMNKSHADIVNAFLQNSYFWTNMQILKLHRNMRLQHSPQDSSFTNWLIDVSHGWHTDNDGNVNLPQSMITFSEDGLIDKIYGDIDLISLTPPPINYFLDYTILAPWNINVQETNDKILKKMKRHEIIYHSTDSLENEGEEIPDDLIADFLRTVDSPSLPLSKLKMEIDCPLMLLWNLDPGKGLCNSTRMILLRAYPQSSGNFKIYLNLLNFYLPHLLPNKWNKLEIKQKTLPDSTFLLLISLKMIFEGPLRMK